ncbi:MAG: hypothetical protein K2K45_07295 [Muribaculaceae bacterium]|nr:hypothetical protein [Muribaculaceae bacterium]
MYTRSHAYIAKVLRDTDFWNELDEISGPRWPIFAVQPLAQGQYRYPAYPPGVLGMMVPTWEEPNENRKYLDVFSLEESSDLPCFIVFIWNDDDELEQITFKLSNSNLEEAFDSIREIVTVVSKAEQRIHPFYRKTDRVFSNVKKDIKAHMVQKKIKRSFEYFPYIYDFISRFLP